MMLWTCFRESVQGLVALFTAGWNLIGGWPGLSVWLIVGAVIGLAVWAVREQWREWKARPRDESDEGEQEPLTEKEQKRALAWLDKHQVAVALDVELARGEAVMSEEESE